MCRFPTCDAIPKHYNILMYRQRNGGCVGCTMSQNSCKKWQILDNCVWESCETCTKGKCEIHYMPLSVTEKILYGLYAFKYGQLYKNWSLHNIELTIREKIYEYRCGKDSIYLPPFDKDMFF